MLGNPSYDVFLSYNSLDHLLVEHVAKALASRAVSAFVDRWYLTPGHDWVVALEQALQSSRAVVIFLGPHPMGRWQQRERAWALDQLAGRSDFPVIPVLLPNCELPLGFLKQLMWIDLRVDSGREVKLDKLAAAIRGEQVDRNGLMQPRSMVCPYRGLLSFREEDAEFYFGRKVYEQKLIELIDKQKFVAVIGASGSGKSSLVGAGLVPRLRAFGTGPVWDVVRMVPHVDPLYSLAAALVPLIDPDLSKLALERELNGVANDLEQPQPTTPLWGLVNAVLRQQPGTDRLLLFVDQWEELYTSCENPQRRIRFVQELLAATSRKESPLTVVLTVRGDFYTDILNDRQLLDRISNSHLDLGPMNLDELRSTIEGPASNVGLTFQDGLIDRILAEAGAEPGNLPLLEFALEELWNRRAGSQLTHAAYEDLGRQENSSGAAVQAEAGGPLSRAIATYAEKIYRELPQDEQEACPSLFRKLVRAGSRSENDTRRRIKLSELDETARRVARRLADKRLLITSGGMSAINMSVVSAAGTTDPAAVANSDAVDETTVEVAHEELLRRWGHLKGWVNEDRKFLLWRTNLELKVDEWRRDGDTALLSGSILRRAREYYPARQEDLDEAQRGYLDRCVGVEKRRKRNLRGLVGAGLAGLVLGGFGVWNVISAERTQADDKKTATAIDSAENNRGPAVLYAIRDLKNLPKGIVVPKLKVRYQKSNSAAKQGLEYALAEFGDVKVQELCARIQTADAGEVDNLATALGHNRKQAQEELRRLADEATKWAKSKPAGEAPGADASATSATDAGSGDPWEWKARLAVMGLHLGDATIASDMSQIQDRPDPIERTVLIDTMRLWHGDVEKILEHAKTSDDVAFLSALVCGIGGIGKWTISQASKEAWITQLKDWHASAESSVLHSSAEWALRQCAIPEAELKLAQSDQSSFVNNWFVNRVGMTMLRLEPGKFVRHDWDLEKMEEQPGPGQPVTLTKRFYLSACEVTVGQFEEFLKDADYPNKDKPQGWEGHDPRVSPDPYHPVQQVDWDDAVLFCNWLSVKSGLEPCYLRNVPSEDPAKKNGLLGKMIPDNNPAQKINWRINTVGSGYRLPTEAEWEYGCRAGTTTAYTIGNDENRLRDRAVYQSSKSSSVGSKQPNGWGLFDMPGNVFEWCHDEFGLYGVDAAIDPMGPLNGGSYRVYRGGSWYFGASDCRSAFRAGRTPDDRYSYLGFRLAAVPSRSLPEAEQSPEAGQEPELE